MKTMDFLKLDKLSKIQLMVISEIARDGAQIIFGGMVIAQLFLENGKTNWYYFTSGTAASIGLWILSVIILKK